MLKLYTEVFLKDVKVIPQNFPEELENSIP